MPATLRLTVSGVNAVGGELEEKVGYFVGLLEILHFGNAFFSSSI